MSADSVWVLGIHMTKFGKHKDKDLTDLGSEAILGALHGGYLDVLVTNELTAARLLELERRRPGSGKRS